MRPQHRRQGSLCGTRPVMRGRVGFRSRVDRFGGRGEGARVQWQDVKGQGASRLVTTQPRL
eukprot:4660897-Prymnesium_polylepis.1